MFGTPITSLNSCEGILKLLKEGQSIQHHLSFPLVDVNVTLILLVSLPSHSKGKVRDVIRLLFPVNQKDILDPSQIIPDKPDNGRTVLQLLIREASRKSFTPPRYTHE